MTPTRTPSPAVPHVSPQLLKVRRYSRLFVWAMCATWLLSLAPMIYRLGMLPLAMLAIGLGVVAFWTTFGLPHMVSLRIMLGIGGAMAGAFAIVGIFWLAISPEIVALDSCRRSALTPQGQLVCQQEFQDSVKERYGFEVP